MTIPVPEVVPVVSVAVPALPGDKMVRGLPLGEVMLMVADVPLVVMLLLELKTSIGVLMVMALLLLFTPVEALKVILPPEPVAIDVVPVVAPVVRAKLWVKVMV
jgi:hypothetical protein